MKPTLLLIAIFIALSTFSYTQKDKGPPNLSGTWKLKSASKNTSTGSATRREVGDNLVITQTDNELVFVGTSVVRGIEQTNRLTFYPDGRGEENLWTGSKHPVKTVTNWDERVLRILEIREVTFRGPTYGVKKAELKIKEEWTLSKDGKKVTQRIRDNWFEIDPMIREVGGTAAYSMEVKHVYERQPQ